jgi:hypothetical protein
VYLGGEYSSPSCFQVIRPHFSQIGPTDGEDQLDPSVRSEEILPTVMEVRNILHTIKIRKGNWIGHILRRNCLLKHVINGIVVKGR